jgi:hypothetical protein
MTPIKRRHLANSAAVALAVSALVATPLLERFPQTLGRLTSLTATEADSRAAQGGPNGGADGLGTAPGVQAPNLDQKATGRPPVEGPTGTAPPPPPAGNPPVRDPSPGRPPAGGRPAPHIITQFANGLKGERKAISTQPRPVPLGNDVDGCNHDYGEPGQCVPLHLPPGQHDWCAYLAHHGMAHPKVHGRDSLGLDPRHTGSACS